MKRNGFTLAELLIALAILGVIATFTIPKVLQSQQSTAYNSAAKETMASISAAYQSYKLTTSVTSAFRGADLTPYLNYVAVDTTSNMDDQYTQVGPQACSGMALGGCLKLHGGGLLRYNGSTLNGTASTNALMFMFDLDGTQTDSTTNGPGKSLMFFLYYDGKLRTRGNTEPNTTNSGTTWATPAQSLEPPWFNWN